MNGLSLNTVGGIIPVSPSRMSTGNLLPVLFYGVVNLRLIQSELAKYQVHFIVLLDALVNVIALKVDRSEWSV